MSTLIFFKEKVFKATGLVPLVLHLNHDGVFILISQPA